MIKRIHLLSFIGFFGLSLASHKALSINSESYTCKVSATCLSELNDNFLDKNSEGGIYQYCKDTYNDIKSCCKNPAECRQSYAKNLTKKLQGPNISQLLGDSSSCQLRSLSNLISFISNIQGDICNAGVDACHNECEDKLNEFKQDFKECFFISDDQSITDILKKANSPPPNEKACYDKMKKLAKKYQDQSLNKAHLLREELKSTDITQCEKIKTAKTTQASNHLALSVCSEAKAKKEEKQKQTEEEKQTQKEREEQAQQEREKQMNAQRQTKQNQFDQRERDFKKERAAKEKEDSNLAKGLIGVGAVVGGATALSKHKEAYLKKEADTAERFNSLLEDANNQEIDLKEDQNFLQRTLNKGKILASNTKNRFDIIQDSVASTLGFSNAPFHCPVTILESAIVWQSVEAPQIEPMADLPTPNEYYNNYDLIRDKPAVILLKISDSAFTLLSDEEKVSIQLRIDDKLIEYNECSKFIPQQEIEDKNNDVLLKSNEINDFTFDNCKFTVKDIKEAFSAEKDIKDKSSSEKKKFPDTKYVYQFITLPTRKIDYPPSKKTTTHQASIELNIQMNKDICMDEKKFSYSLRETKHLFLDFMTFDFKNTECSDFTVKDWKVKRFSQSKEVTKYLPMMLPTTKDKIHLTLSTENTPAYCDNTTHDTNQQALKIRESKGFLIDTLNAELYIRNKINEQIKKSNSSKEKFLKDNFYIITHRHRLSSDYRYYRTKEKFQLISNTKVMVIVSEDYFKFHDNGNDDDNYRPPAGLINHTYSSNVAFILDDQRNKATILHELSHLLGQDKEMYFSKSKNELGQEIKIVDDCKAFNDREKVDCDNDYKIQGFQASFGNNFPWKFLNDTFTFMNNVPIIKNNWIDRET